MKCDYRENCSNGATVQLFLSVRENRQNLSVPNYYCDIHAAAARNEGIVNKEVNLLNANAKFIIGSTARETSKFKGTLQDLKTDVSQE